MEAVDCQIFKTHQKRYFLGVKHERKFVILVTDIGIIGQKTPLPLRYQKASVDF
jgi:hypothetical protein